MISTLLARQRLNGDVPAPHLDAEDVASEIERYVDAVTQLMEG